MKLPIKLILASCIMAIMAWSDEAARGNDPATAVPDLTFAEDVSFLREHVDTIVLGTSSGGPQVAVVPAYQGRVMTSTATGPDGQSYGWINYDHLRAGKITPHINVYGGEERFWLGPEGGQFSIFFPPAAEFSLANWQTPPLIDTQPFETVETTDSVVRFRRAANLDNYAGTNFRFRIDRTVTLLTRSDARRALDVDLRDSPWVGYRTTNRITNTGRNDWTKQGGLLSIWLLGMYKPGETTTVVIPFRQGDPRELGPVVNDEYFGKVPAERLRIGDGVIFFSGDGQYRSKIGVTPQRATGVCGSYDPDRNVLTIVKYNQPLPDVTDYVNSMWEIQEEPYGGDAINSYNDGPPAPGAQPLGPFYELETSSPALELASGETSQHVQETYHVEGERATLDRLAQHLFGVSLTEIEQALGGDR